MESIIEQAGAGDEQAKADNASAEVARTDGVDAQAETTGELSEQNLEEVAGGDLWDWIDKQYTAYKHGVQDGYNGR